MTQTQHKWWTLKTYLPEMHMMKKSVTDIAIISEREDRSKGKHLADRELKYMENSIRYKENKREKS